MEVQILSRKLLKPSSPTPLHLWRLRLSPLIDLHLKHNRNRAENHERHEHLEKSLSEILNHFYPTGRHIKDDESVDCNDQGVEYLDAKVDIQLNQLLSRRRDSIEQMNSLIQLPYGGLVISICICHAIADGFTMVKFITELLLPCFNLASLFSTKVLPMLKPPPPPRVFELDKVVTRQFVFDGAEISTLKAKSNPRSCDVGVKPKPSRVEVVTTVIWKALIRVSEAKYGRLRTSLVVHSMNLRAKIVFIVPHNCCGDLYRLVAVRFTGDMSKMELPDLVVLLSDAISVNALCCEDVFPTVVKSFNNVNEESKKKYVDVHMFTSWCRFPTYEADFGWEKPT
ncbi:hypothetical protein PVL29_003732 [Vitis rotundifolia]|uniref:Uncharacterized protein n=1 Tax=Vitis rotundifolia TaxID=103349 RepID=A0AA39AEJ4_VITRO|nr:hypothetical protein PVL29_003732 [Vitis rotundifolia]